MSIDDHDLSRKLSYVRENGPPRTLWDELQEQVEGSLLARKGLLLLLCPPETNPEALREVYARYYAGSRYDVIPELGDALAASYEQHPQLRHKLPLGAVILGLDVYLVGTEGAAVWMTHHDGIKAILGVGAGVQKGLPVAQGAAEGESWTLRGAHVRLMVGDRLILSTRAVAERLRGARLKALARRRSADDLAAGVSGSLGRRRREPALVIEAPAFAPIAPFRPTPVAGQPAAQAPRRRRPRSGVRPRGERSPIWTALFVAAVAAGFSLWIRRPGLSREQLAEWRDLLLTPRPVVAEDQAELAHGTVDPSALVRPTQPVERRPSATPSPGALAAESAAARPAPSATPTAKIYAIPALISPAEGEHLTKTYLTLEWEWDGDLAEDEYFDVRLWRIGSQKRGIAWTKQTQYVERSGHTGWHSWTVAVVRGREGVVLAELVEAPAVEFKWTVRGGEEPRPVPTRVAPEHPPTRAAP
ncbi:MAG: hypothetical protein JXA74_06375 [Anaerolineae bacterium]|nr:hypothetical protein [Anaerolineae bacterium]